MWQIYTQRTQWVLLAGLAGLHIIFYRNMNTRQYVRSNFITMSASGYVLYDKNPGMVNEHTDNIHVATYGPQYSIHNFIYRFAVTHSGVPRIFFGGGFQQIRLRTDSRENGDLGTVDP
jgi:hypothetical protein